MDSVDAAAALKSSFREAVKTTHPNLQHQQQGLIDEVWGEDELLVDEFLDFSNEDGDGFLLESQEEKGGDGEKDWSCGSAFSSLEEETHLAKISDSNSNHDFEPELCVPTDDLANLEWLSHFVEDSFSQFPSSDSGSIFMENPGEGKIENPEKTGSKEARTGCLGLTIETPVPAKARSKRPRTGGRVWSVHGHGRHLAETSPTSSSSSSYSSSSSSSSSTFSSLSSPSSCLIFAKTGQNQDLYESIGKPPGKKLKKGKKNPLAVSDNGQLQQPQRRCSHCLVQKTPQWRTGPLGAKTLCNACGVRYKSGRLLPEYRPAGSPTFLSHVHSNSHRKVLEMRRKKETSAIEPGPLAVQSF